MNLVTKNLRDPFTGCFLPEYILEYEQSRITETEEATWGCVFIYIDHYRQYVDRVGWDASQMTLLRLSRFLLRHIRADEGVIRLKEDEWLLVLNEVTETTIFRICKRIQSAALSQAPVPFSIGYAARREGESLHSTYDRATRRLIPVKVLERQNHKPRRPLH